MPDELRGAELGSYGADDTRLLYQTLQSSFHSAFEDVLSSMGFSLSPGLQHLPLDNRATSRHGMLPHINCHAREDFMSGTETLHGHAHMHYHKRNGHGPFRDNKQFGKTPCKRHTHTENRSPPQRQGSYFWSSTAATPRQGTGQLSPKENMPPKMSRMPPNTPVIQMNTAPEVPQTPVKPFRELIERYQAETLLETERILGDAEGSRVRYQLRMEANQTNLKVLRKALEREDLSAELYTLAKDLTKRCMNISERRLATLVRKYLAHQTVQELKSNLNARMHSAREHNNGEALRDLYMLLVRMEWYKSLVTKRWTARQMTIEGERQTCLAQMLYLFRQFELDLGVILIKPYVCVAKSQAQHFPSVIIQSKVPLNVGTYRPTPVRIPPVSALAKQPRVLPQPSVREISKPMALATWSFDDTMYNIQVASKPPAKGSTMTPMLPRISEMDISQSRQRALRTLQSRGRVMMPMMSRGQL
ncbi:protein FAM186A-like [Engraulis encrasicolus]|uniref:protein FAM186A-like n=1 Tax=Engraulis encrasicolus TaxID=184585 RepID=UPI002FD293EB